MSTTRRERTRRTTIVTQLSPDLDACLSVWLLRRFGGCPNAELAFVSTGSRLPREKDRGHVIYVDTSGGKYDHHQTNARVCAASLVFHDLKLESDQALAKLIDFAILVDHGLILDADISDFNLIHIIYGLNRVFPDDPTKVVAISGQMFDALYVYFKDHIAARDELDKAVRFETRWGPAIGVMTSNRQVRYIAHHLGYKIFVYVDRTTGFRGFQAPGGSGVDFSEVYKRIRNVEPDADWFLHASKELLLCGSPKAPEKRLSRLCLKELISLVATQGELYAQVPEI